MSRPLLVLVAVLLCGCVRTQAEVRFDAPGPGARDGRREAPQALVGVFKLLKYFLPRIIHGETAAIHGETAAEQELERFPNGCD